MHCAGGGAIAIVQAATDSPVRGAHLLPDRTRQRGATEARCAPRAAWRATRGDRQHPGAADAATGGAPPPLRGRPRRRRRARGGAPRGWQARASSRSRCVPAVRWVSTRPGVTPPTFSACLHRSYACAGRQAGLRERTRRCCQKYCDGHFSGPRVAPGGASMEPFFRAMTQFCWVDIVARPIRIAIGLRRKSRQQHTAGARS